MNLLDSVKEQDIINWMNHNQLTFINCACEFTRTCDSNDSISKRKEIKRLIKNLKKINPNIDHNIFKSLDNINLNCVLGYKKDNTKYSFLDEFNN